MIPYTAVASSVVIVVGFINFPGSFELVTWIIRFWSKSLLWLFGIELKISGEELLPQEGGGVVVFNHQSLFDILVLMASTHRNIRFGAKIELFKIPFFGGAMRASGTLPIARENRAEVMKIYKDAEARFKINTLFVLAPEGTRQKEPVIGRFKKGPFIFAINAKVPLIPVVVTGTHAVLPKRSLNVNVGQLRRKIGVQYLPPIPTTAFTLGDVERLTESARQQMVERFELSKQL